MYQNAKAVAAIPESEATVETASVRLSDVQGDWRLLDNPDWKTPDHVKLISHEQFSGEGGHHVEYVAPRGIASFLRRFKRVFPLLYAWQLLRRCDANTVLIVNGGTSIWLFVGLLNRFLYRSSRRVLLWDVFVEVNEEWKRRIMAAAMQGASLAVLWSRGQIEPHAKFLRLPENRFIFLPFKANHSKGPRYSFPPGNFVFSGGNGKRDYRCLIEAVRGTDIPVIISATDPKVRATIEPLPNVIVLGAPEPGFAQLQAASRFVVISMQHTGLKGGGEANFCNAMWHGKPIIAADSIAAADYIVEGETGYVVPAGDSQRLRERMLKLWRDPERCEEMGREGHRHTVANFTHEMVLRRLVRLAFLLGKEGEPRDSLSCGHQA